MLRQTSIGDVPASDRPLSPVALLLWTVFSFEFLFALGLSANALKMLLGVSLPVDENILFAVVAAPIALAIVFRRGIYLRALTCLAAYLLFVAWTIFSMGWSPSRALARETVFLELTMLLWSLCAAAFVIAPDRDRVIRFVLSVCLLATSMAAIGLAIYAVHGSFMYYMTASLKAMGFGKGRAYLLVGHAVAPGTVAMFTLAIFARLGSLRQILFAAGCLAAFAFLSIAGSRGAFLAAVLGCLTVVAITNLPAARGPLRMSTAQGIAMGLGLVAVAILATLVGSGLETTTIRRFATLLKESQNVDVVLERNRFDYYTMAIEYWIDNPLFGLGVAGFSVAEGRGERAGTHPHNIILEILANYGLIGLLLFVFLLWSVLRHLPLQRLARDQLALVLLGMFVVVFAAAMTHEPLARHPALMAMLGLLLLPPATAPDVPAPRPAAAGLARRPGRIVVGALARETLGRIRS